MKRSTVDRKKLSPMMAQYMELKDKYEDCIVFYRLGDFYEMFFEDAIIASRELELTLTGKSAGLEERVPMCGIPHHAYSSYIDQLIEKGYKVAIAEQLEDPKTAKGTVKRDVIQVVTRGTRLDNNLDSKNNNYIANIYDFDYCKGIAYTDISTGEFFCELLEKDNEDVEREIVKRGFRELIVSENTDRELINTLRVNYGILISITKELYDGDDYKYIYEDIDDIRLETTIKHLLHYVLDTKKGDLHHLKKCELITRYQTLLFDNNTKKNLELVETIRSRDRQYSLLWLLDKCKTAMGSRFLKHQIENPVTDKKELERRYDFVEKISTEFIIRDDLRTSLDAVYDLERLAGRISYGNLNARDMLQLKRSLKELPKIKELLNKLDYDKEIEPLEEVEQLLEKTIKEDPPLSLKEGSIIKDGYNSELDELRSVSSGSKDFILSIEQKEKERTGIKSLKVGFNKIFGYYIEVSKGQKALVKEEYGYERRQTLANCERYITKELKEKENIILGAEEKIINLEYKLFMDIREIVKRYISKIQEISKIISEVDMLLSFSIVSDENKFIRPKLVETKELRLIECRHPVVEKVIKDKYVSNDIIMDNNTNILLITGPNMAGKSTYMRQLGIIAIMAQIGCFVPATEANLPVFDKIFTRIGASDDLVSGESTFMVEMMEASRAIKGATKNSLILFDELGRGTATYDGMSLAEAILEYIAKRIKCKTLFSTHYHELTDMENSLPNLKNKHVSAIEDGGNITFLHKVKDGSVDKSYGINVAMLAGLPSEVIDRANVILKEYESKNDNSTSKKKKKNDDSFQYSLPLDFEEKKSEVEEEIKKIDVLNITPMEAINILSELKEKIK